MTMFTQADYLAVPDAQRQSILAAIYLLARIDGEMDASELAVARPFLEVTPAIQLKPVQAEVGAVKSAKDVMAMGKRCADALPDPAARERLVTLLLAIAWADGAFAANEHNVIGAIMQGIGLPGERANALADEAAESNIFGAIARGKVDAVRKLLDSGVSVMSRDPRQWTPLHVAVATGQAAVVDLLLERGADVHARHSQGSPPLFLACNKPYERIVERLVRAGAKVDEVNASAGGLSPLIIAALMGQVGVARALRAGGAPLDAVDGKGLTALHNAAGEGKVATAIFLIAEGAAVNARSPEGLTPLMNAVGSLAVVSALLAAKADASAVDGGGQSALHYAVVSNAPETVAMLLASGSDPNLASKNGTSPLHIAAGGGRTACAKLLLDAGAKVDAKNGGGAVPIELATANDNREVMELLVARGSAPGDASKLGSGLNIKSLRAVALGELHPDRALRPSDAVLAAHGDYQMAVWTNREGTPDQLLVTGNDAHGRPEYVGRGTNEGDPRARFMAVTDRAGRRFLPVFTSESAATNFRRRTELTWPDGGTGVAAAVTGSIPTSVFRLVDLPVDGVVLNPYGPNGPVFLASDECDRVTRGR